MVHIFGSEIELSLRRVIELQTKDPVCSWKCVPSRLARVGKELDCFPSSFIHT